MKLERDMGDPEGSGEELWHVYNAHICKIPKE